MALPVRWTPAPLTFLERMGAKVALIDAKDYGLADAVPASVVTYFNPLLHLAVMREYGNQIAEARQHPLTCVATCGSFPTNHK